MGLGNLLDKAKDKAGDKLSDVKDELHKIKDDPKEYAKGKIDEVKKNPGKFVKNVVKKQVVKAVAKKVLSESEQRVFGTNYVERADNWVNDKIEDGVNGAIDLVKPAMDTSFEDALGDLAQVARLHETLSKGAPELAHVGSPVLCSQHGVVYIEGGDGTTHVGDRAVAVEGDLTTCGGRIVKATGSMIIRGRRAARVGDLIDHVGVILRGEPTCRIG